MTGRRRAGGAGLLRRPWHRTLALTALVGLLIGAALAAWALPAPARTPHARPVRAHHPARRTAHSRHRPAAPAARRKVSRSRRPAAFTIHRDWRGRWSTPAAAVAPAPTDLLPPVLAIGPSGRIALGSGTTNEDDPANAHAGLTEAAGSAALTTTPLTGIQQTLAAGFSASQLALLVGTSPPNQSCCSSASVLLPAGGGFAGHQVAVGLQGATAGAIVPVHRGLLAAVDNQSGITVARIDPTADTVRTAQLLGPEPTPPVIALTATATGAALAWTAPAVAAQTVTGTSTTAGTSTAPASVPAAGYDQPQNRLIDFALAGPDGLPGSTQLALRIPAGREVDALALAPHGRGATLAWTETWFSAGHFRSEVFWSELRRGAVPHALSSPTADAVGVSLAGTASGHQVLAWQSCTTAAASCRTVAALRPAGGAWTPVRDLGPVDPSQFPVAAMSRLGQPLVGWISGGVVYARPGVPGARTFLLAHRLSVIPSGRAAGGGGAAALTLAFGPGAGVDGNAVAAWVQGTVDQELLSARFTP